MMNKANPVISRIGFAQDKRMIVLDSLCLCMRGRQLFDDESVMWPGLDRVAWLLVTKYGAVKCTCQWTRKIGDGACRGRKMAVMWRTEIRKQRNFLEEGKAKGRGGRPGSLFLLIAQSLSAQTLRQVRPSLDGPSSKETNNARALCEAGLCEVYNVEKKVEKSRAEHETLFADGDLALLVLLYSDGNTHKSVPANVALCLAAGRIVGLFAGMGRRLKQARLGAVLLMSGV